MKKQNNKTLSLAGNETIRDAIRKIALHNIVDKNTGSVKDSARISGYVAKVHLEGDLAGTIDVQEYSGLASSLETPYVQGYHEGVYLSAIQNNLNGMVVIPKLYSEVIIAEDSALGIEYVVMFSHVDYIQLDSHENLSIGVKEREEYNVNDEEAPDVHELANTGVEATTKYTKDSIITNVSDTTNTAVQSILPQEYKVDLGNGKSVYVIDNEKIKATHSKSNVLLNDSSAIIESGASKVKVNDGVVYVGSENGVDDAVLGVELANILTEMLDYVSQIKTTTSIGIQPIINLPQFIALKAKINSFKASHSGFLTKKVQIQK